MTSFDRRLMDNPQTILDNIDKIVKDSWESNEIPQDATWGIVNTVDNQGNKLQAAFKVHKGDKLNVKVKAIWEHDWDGDDTVAGKVVFSGK